MLRRIIVISLPHEWLGQETNTGDITHAFLWPTSQTGSSPTCPVFRKSQCRTDSPGLRHTRRLGFSLSDENLLLATRSSRPNHLMTDTPAEDGAERVLA